MPGSNSARAGRTANAHFLCATTARDLIRAMRTGFSEPSSVFTRQRSFPARAWVSPRCNESSTGMAEKFGRKEQSKKARRYISLCEEINLETKRGYGQQNHFLCLKTTPAAGRSHSTRGRKITLAIKRSSHAMARLAAAL